MKKFTFLIVSMFFVIGILAQDNTQRKELLCVPSAGAIDDAPAVQKEFPDFTRTKTIFDEDIVIGETRYDLQTNSAIQNRIWAYDDGTMAAVWTMGFSDPTFPGRGTGYNYYDGSDWGPIPDERIQSVRCGWPAYAPFGENGEITVSHSADNTLIFNWRENKGEGAWNEFEFEGPEGSAGLLWPRMVTSGPNHDTIHLIAITVPTGNGGTIYEGMDGALLYSRSVDGGTTWDPENQLIPEINSDYFDAIGADAYSWAHPNAGKLAFVVNGSVRDGVVVYSEDGGDNWDRMEFYEFPWGGTPPDETMRFGATDGALAVGIDNNGKIHVVAGRMCWRLEGGGRYYYPYSNGLLYWNEDMDPMDTVLVEGSSVYLVPQQLEDEGYLIDKVSDPIDSLAADVTRAYETSITSEPRIVFDEFNNIIVTYQKLAPGFVSGDFNYRHIWKAWSFDNGATWEYKEDLTDDIYHMFSECSFPSTAPLIQNDLIHCVYQTSTSPGLAIGANADHEYIDNNMVYLPIGINVGMEENTVNDIKYVSQNYPNPFTNQSMVQVNTSSKANLKMVINNIIGKQIAVIDKGKVDAGTHYFTIDGNNLPGGVYFYTILSGNNSVTKKMIVE